MVSQDRGDRGGGGRGGTGGGFTGGGEAGFKSKGPDLKGEIGALSIVSVVAFLHCTADQFRHLSLQITENSCSLLLIVLCCLFTCSSCHVTVNCHPNSKR